MLEACFGGRQRASAGNHGALEQLTKVVVVVVVVMMMMMMMLASGEIRGISSSGEGGK